MKFYLPILFLIVCSCNGNLRLIEQGKSATYEDAQLGESQYHIKLPKSFRLEEARGKEGQLGYDIIPIDTSLKMLGFIEIKRGHPINGGRIRKWGKLQEKVQSTFLNRKTVWNIYRTEMGFFVATTPLWDISSDVSSNRRTDIDTLISIVSTLTKK